jgi:copper chaperone CopZ
MRKAICVLGLLCLGSQVLVGEAAPLSSTSSTPSSKASSSARPSALRRLDFHIDGVSCARCILNIRAALRKAPGVFKCEISLRAPYGAVVIYDGQKVKMQELIKVAQTADPKTQVQIKEPVEKALKEMPLVLFPVYNTLKKN